MDRRAQLLPRRRGAALGHAGRRQAAADGQPGAVPRRADPARYRRATCRIDRPALADTPDRIAVRRRRRAACPVDAGRRLRARRRLAGGRRRRVQRGARIAWPGAEGRQLRRPLCHRRHPARQPASDRAPDAPGSPGSPNATLAPDAPDAWDSTGRLFNEYGAVPGALYLVRPDGHVLARWKGGPDHALATAAEAAIQRMLQAGAPP